MSNFTKTVYNPATAATCVVETKANGKTTDITKIGDKLLAFVHATFKRRESDEQKMVRILSAMTNINMGCVKKNSEQSEGVFQSVAEAICSKLVGESKNEDLQSKIDELESENAELNETVNSLSEELGRLEGDGDNSELKSENAKLLEKIKDLQKRLTDTAKDLLAAKAKKGAAPKAKKPRAKSGLSMVHTLTTNYIALTEADVTLTEFKKPPYMAKQLGKASRAEETTQDFKDGMGVLMPLVEATTPVTKGMRIAEQTLRDNGLPYTCMLVFLWKNNGDDMSIEGLAELWDTHKVKVEELLVDVPKEDVKKVKQVKSSHQQFMISMAVYNRENPAQKIPSTMWKKCFKVWNEAKLAGEALEEIDGMNPSDYKPIVDAVHKYSKANPPKTTTTSRRAGGRNPKPVVKTWISQFKAHLTENSDSKEAGEPARIEGVKSTISTLVKSGQDLEEEYKEPVRDAMISEMNMRKAAMKVYKKRKMEDLYTTQVSQITRLYKFRKYMDGGELPFEVVENDDGSQELSIPPYNNTDTEDETEPDTTTIHGVDYTEEEAEQEED